MATSSLPPLAADRSRSGSPSVLARNWELLRELVRRDLQSRHKGSALGNIWSLLNPLLFMIVYSVVFSRFVRFQTSVPYPVFLVPALLGWNFFSQGLLFSSQSVLGNAPLVKKVAFPRMLLTVSSITAAFINYLISLVLLVPLLLFYRVPVGPPILLVPVLAALVYTLALGLGLLLAAGTVYFRDIDYLLGIAIYLWFFLTPIIYTYDGATNPYTAQPCQATGGLTVAAAHASDACQRSVHGFHYLQTVLNINPLTWFSTSFQDVVAYHSWPAHPLGLLYATACAGVALAVGYLVFKRVEGGFAEEL